MALPERVKLLIAKHSPNMVQIDLENQGISNNDVSELSHLLEKNHYIFSLKLRRNNISEDGMRVLAELTRLQMIDVSQNAIGDNAIIAFADVIEKLKPKLTILKLDDNNITPVSINSLRKLRNKDIKIVLNDNPEVMALLNNENSEKNIIMNDLDSIPEKKERL